MYEPELDVSIFGVEGDVIRGTSAGFDEEDFDLTPDGPQGRGWLRSARVIGQHTYVVGMSRQVYRRGHQGSWSRMDHGLLASPPPLS